LNKEACLEPIPDPAGRLLAAALACCWRAASFFPPAQLYAPLPQWRGQGFGKNKIQYRSSTGRSTTRPISTCTTTGRGAPAPEGGLLRRERLRPALAASSTSRSPEPTPLIFYETHSAFEQNNIILNFIPEGVGAFATPARFRMVMPVDMPDAELMQLILHELTHIFQYHILFQGSLGKALTNQPPTWFDRGDGQLHGQGRDGHGTACTCATRWSTTRSRAITEQNFGGFFAYRIGHAFFDFIEERWGKEGFLDFVYELRNTLGGPGWTGRSSGPSRSSPRSSTPSSAAGCAPSTCRS
jgi:hypothetical protein